MGRKKKQLRVSVYLGETDNPDRIIYEDLLRKMRQANPTAGPSDVFHFLLHSHSGVQDNKIFANEYKRILSSMLKEQRRLKHCIEEGEKAGLPEGWHNEL